MISLINDPENAVPNVHFQRREVVVVVNGPIVSPYVAEQLGSRLATSSIPRTMCGLRSSLILSRDGSTATHVRTFVGNLCSMRLDGERSCLTSLVSAKTRYHEKYILIEI